MVAKIIFQRIMTEGFKGQKSRGNKKSEKNANYFLRLSRVKRCRNVPGFKKRRNFKSTETS